MYDEEGSGREGGEEGSNREEGSGGEVEFATSLRCGAEGLGAIS